MVSLPNILFQVGVKGRKLSDIEFLSIKEFEGKVRSDESRRTTVGDLATLTANSGKDMYLATAKVNMTGNFSLNASCTVKLSINGIVIETAAFLSSGGTLDLAAEGLLQYEYEFKNIGRKVAATQIIKLEVTAEIDIIVEGFIECFEEDTGNSPQIPSI